MRCNGREDANPDKLPVNIQPWAACRGQAEDIGVMAVMQRGTLSRKGFYGNLQDRTKDPQHLNPWAESGADIANLYIGRRWCTYCNFGNPRNNSVENTLGLSNGVLILHLWPNSCEGPAGECSGKVIRAVISPLSFTHLLRSSIFIWIIQPC